jgi:hypothetical protein
MGSKGKKVLWTLQRSRCWDTGRGLAERITLGYDPETLSYSYPTSVLCNLINCDLVESTELTDIMAMTFTCVKAAVSIQREGWLGELLYCVP